MSWSSYNNSHEVISDLDLLEKEILNNEQKSVERLLSLLIPTGDLQEIAISSGWECEFLKIADTLETEFSEE